MKDSLIFPIILYPTTVLTPLFKNCGTLLSRNVNCLELVPSKLLSRPPRHPWIDTQIKRLSNKKKCLYNRAHTSCLELDWIAYRDIRKKQVKREYRKAHNTYVSKLIDGFQLQYDDITFLHYKTAFTNMAAKRLQKT